MAVERKRGCSYRKIGGLYLCSEALSEPCHRLPVELKICPTCHAGIKPSRGWTWVDSGLLRPGCGEKLEADLTILSVEGMLPSQLEHCERCPICSPAAMGEKVGLLWIGEKFYGSMNEFVAEAATQGVSRRIAAIPRGFEAGRHWVLLAHRKAIREKCECASNWGGVVEDCEKCEGRGVTFVAGVVTAFRPWIEKMLADDATPEEVEAWEKRGCKVVKLPRNDPDHAAAGRFTIDEVQRALGVDDLVSRGPVVRVRVEGGTIGGGD